MPLRGVPAGVPCVRDTISRHASLASKGMTDEQFLKICDKLMHARRADRVAPRFKLFRLLPSSANAAPRMHSGFFRFFFKSAGSQVGIARYNYLVGLQSDTSAGTGEGIVNEPGRDCRCYG